VHLMRDELYDIRLARESGDRETPRIPTGHYRHGSGFALTLSSARGFGGRADPEARASHGVRGRRTRQAAEHGDLADIDVQTTDAARCRGPRRVRPKAVRLPDAL
jgi:hypothetical protein